MAKELKRMRIEAGYTSYENFAVEHDLDRKHYWMMEKGTIPLLKRCIKY